MCTVGFGPEESRRVGDYRGWLRGSTGASKLSANRIVDPDLWVRSYELWRMDLREIDLDLVGDKIERAFRETYNKYLLTDAGSSRLVLVLPSLMPHPLLSKLLSTLFSRWRFPSITLLPTATAATVAAGLRAALVVDLGWAETTATAVYEYREIVVRRSTRAMRSLMQETGIWLSSVAAEDTAREASPENGISVDFEFCEEVISRFVWCRDRDDGIREPSDEQEPSPTPSTTQAAASPLAGKKVSIPSPTNPTGNYIEIPFAKFSDPVEKVLLAHGMADHELDDQEKPIPLLLYNTLLSLPPDVRGACMSRIVFVGGGANIPGLRRRVLQEVKHLVQRHGWSPVRGRIIEENMQNSRLRNEKGSSQTVPAGERRVDNTSTETGPSQIEENKTPLQGPHEVTSPDEGVAPEQSQPSSTTIPEGNEIEQSNHHHTDREDDDEVDFVEQKLRRLNRDRDRDTKPYIHGILREVTSLGPWAGASLVASLKVRGTVEIERDKFLQYGLVGASRGGSGGGESSMLSHSAHAHAHGHGHGHTQSISRSHGAAMGGSTTTGSGPDRRSGLRVGGDRSSWTLAGWG